MPSQIERSIARKRLTKLGGSAVLGILAKSKGGGSRALAKKYERTCREVTRRLVECHISRGISDEKIQNNPDLAFLKPTIGMRGEVEESPEMSELIEFHETSRGVISPEDLGGISELFSGHRVSRTDSGLVFENDVTRRGAGRVYTPFDVTSHMCEITIPNLVSNCDSLESFLSLRIIDPACGSGAFLAQASRVLIREGVSRWPESREEVERGVFSRILHGVDLDAFAVSLCRLVLWMEAGAPDEEMGFCLSQTDSLRLGGSPSLDEWSEGTGLESGRGYDLWMGNPPYVRVKPSDFEEFVHRGTRNLYALFCELGMSLTKEDGTFSMILPQGVVVSREAASLRSFLLGVPGSKKFQVFDSVPDFLFDQGKIESNTNTNINQRTTIVTVEKGSEEEILTSPLIRWRRREERNDLFRNLRTIEITHEDTSLGKIPMLGSKEEVALFREMVKISPKIGDRIGSGQKSLFLTKAVRYFITALPRSLGRRNSIEIAVPEEDFHAVHVILNSNVFYWWWRVIGNGFQLEKGDIECFPLIQLDSQRASLLSQRLSRAEKSCKVTKRNAGKDIPNINYNFSMDLIREIDSEILSCFDDLEYDFILKSKSNSLFGKMDGLVGYS